MLPSTLVYKLIKPTGEVVVVINIVLDYTVLIALSSTHPNIYIKKRLVCE